MAIINGGPGDNLLNGFDNEADVISGNDGNDLMVPKTHVVGGAADQVIGGTHTLADTIRVWAMGETLGVRFSVTRITSDSDRYNVIVSECERVDFIGGSGDDFFDLSGAQGGVVDGGAGQDVVDIDLANRVTPLTFVFNPTQINLNYPNGFLIKNMESVSLTSGSGDDHLTGGASSDLLNGGLGNDTFVYTGGNDIYDGGAGIDLIDYGAVITPLSGTGVTVNLAGGRALGPFQTTITSFLSIEAVVGSSGNDDLLGNGFANGLNGGRGNDTLAGRGGDDTLIGGFGHDDLYGEAGNDRLTGGYNEDTLVGGSGKDTLFGQQHNDILQGGAGSDYIDGGSSFDRVSYTDFNSKVVVNLLTGRGTHSGGTDTLRNIEAVYTGKGHDVITGNNVRNILDGGAGNNTIDGRGGHDLIWGDRHKDTLKGGIGNDDIYGMDGRDVITGGAGRDRLFGNYRGDDGDRDVFIYNNWNESPRGSQRDIIQEFGRNDVIDLSRVVGGKFDFLDGVGFSRNGQAEVRILDNGRITGVAADRNGDGVAELEILVNRVDLTASNFLL
ncbi:MAG: calcium-binding protein [Xanthobacteraceae bacterium]